jgi:RNA polymerase sigma factor (sigma-70 family)
VDPGTLNSIIEQCKQNDRASQELLYRHYFPIVYRLIKKRVSDEHDLVTVINDGFLKAFKHIASYDPAAGVFDAWLYTIVVHAAYDHMAAAKKKLQLASIRDDFEASDNSHLFVIDREDVTHLLIKLPTTTGKVLAMSIDGFTHREIAVQLGISEISSRWHLSEARKQVRQILDYKRKMA